MYAAGDDVDVSSCEDWTVWDARCCLRLELGDVADEVVTAMDAARDELDGVGICSDIEVVEMVESKERRPS